jgi:hypothetical protein
MNRQFTFMLMPALLALLAIFAGSGVAAEVRLADKGQARCVIVVPPGSMTWKGAADVLPPLWKDREAELRRRLQRAHFRYDVAVQVLEVALHDVTEAELGVNLTVPVVEGAVAVLKIDDQQRARFGMDAKIIHAGTIQRLNPLKRVP